MWWPFKKKKNVGPAIPSHGNPRLGNLEHYTVEAWTPQDGGYAIPPSLTSSPPDHHSRALSHPIPNGLSLYKPRSRTSTISPLSPRPVSVYEQPEHNTGSAISLYSQSIPRTPPVLGSQGHNANRQTIPSPLSMISHQTPTESFHAQSPSQASQSSQSNLILPLTAPAAPRPRVLQKRSHRTSLVGSSSIQVLSNPGPPRISYEAYKHFQKRYEAAIDEAHEAAREYNGFRPQYQTQEEYKKVAMKYASASHLAQLHYLGRDEHEQHRMFVGKTTDENHEWWREKAKNDWINAYRLAAAWGYNNPHNDPFNPLSTRSWSNAMY